MLIRSTSQCSSGFMFYRVGSTAGSTRLQHISKPTRGRRRHQHRNQQPSVASGAEILQHRVTRPGVKANRPAGDRPPAHQIFIASRAQRRGSALRTEMARPIHSTFCRSSMADCSSASLLRSTKAKPRLRPVSRSSGREHLLTSPYCPKR